MLCPSASWREPGPTCKNLPWQPGTRVLDSFKTGTSQQAPHSMALTVGRRLAHTTGGQTKRSRQWRTKAAVSVIGCRGERGWVGAPEGAAAHSPGRSGGAAHPPQPRAAEVDVPRANAATARVVLSLVVGVKGRLVRCLIGTRRRCQVSLSLRQPTADQPPRSSDLWLSPRPRSPRRHRPSVDAQAIPG